MSGNMVSGNFPASAYKRLLQPLLIAAMLFSAMVPQGFMPSLGADGFSIRMCSGMQDATLHVSRDDPQFELIALVNGIDLDELPAKNEADMQTPCAFAGGFVFVQPSLAENARIIEPGDVVQPHRNYQSPGAHHVAQTPPSTGPPVFS